VWLMKCTKGTHKDQLRAVKSIDISGAENPERRLHNIKRELRAMALFSREKVSAILSITRDFNAKSTWCSTNSGL
jgi:hypothetical protein